MYRSASSGGGIGSAAAWVGQRLSRLRRERVEEATDRLLEIRREAQDTSDAARLLALAREIDDLAGEIAKHALERPTEARTLSAALIAIDAARSTIKRAIATGRTGNATAALSEDMAGPTSAAAE